MPATVSDLGRRYKQKHPAYADIPDRDMGLAVKRKFPGAYDDFTDEPDPAPAPAAKVSAIPPPIGIPGIPGTEKTGLPGVPVVNPKAAIDSYVDIPKSGFDGIVGGLAAQRFARGVGTGVLGMVGSLEPLAKSQERLMQSQWGKALAAPLAPVLGPAQALLPYTKRVGEWARGKADEVGKWEIEAGRPYIGKTLGDNPELRTDPTYYAGVASEALGSLASFLVPGKLAQGVAGATKLPAVIDKLTMARPALRAAAQNMPGTAVGAALESLVNSTDTYSTAMQTDPAKALDTFYSTLIRDFPVTLLTNAIGVFTPKTGVGRLLDVGAESGQEGVQNIAAQSALEANLGDKAPPMSGMTEALFGGGASAAAVNLGQMAANAALKRRMRGAVPPPIQTPTADPAAVPPPTTVPPPIATAAPTPPVPQAPPVNVPMPPPAAPPPQQQPPPEWSPDPTQPKQRTPAEIDAEMARITAEAEKIAAQDEAEAKAAEQAVAALREQPAATPPPVAPVVPEAPKAEPPPTPTLELQRVTEPGVPVAPATVSPQPTGKEVATNAQEEARQAEVRQEEQTKVGEGVIGSEERLQSGPPQVEPLRPAPRELSPSELAFGQTAEDIVLGKPPSLPVAIQRARQELGAGAPYTEIDRRAQEIARGEQPKPTLPARIGGDTIGADGQPSGQGKGPSDSEAVPRSGGTHQETTIRIPGSAESYPARYAIKELDEVAASHSGLTFQPNQRYQPHNERNYDDPVNQERVVADASEAMFEPGFLVNNLPSVTDGPPAIDPQGNVLGGNSRVMKLERVYEANGGAAKRYRDALIQQAGLYGIDPTAIAGMRRPVLVRTLDEETLADGGRQRLIRGTNKSGTAELTAAERSTADAGALSTDAVQYIQNVLDAAGPDATLRDVLATRAGAGIINRLVEDGVFTPQEKPKLADGRTGAVTQFAKDRIEQMLLGRLFRDSEQYQRSAASMRERLVKVSGQLTRLDGEWDLVPSIREAVDLIEYADAHGVKQFEDVTRQVGMFGDEPTFSPQSVALAKKLTGRIDPLRKALQQYTKEYEAATNPTSRMFGEPMTQTEAFAEFFGDTAEADPVRIRASIPAQIGSPKGWDAVEPSPQEPLETIEDAVSQMAGGRQMVRYREKNNTLFVSPDVGRVFAAMSGYEGGIEGLSFPRSEAAAFMDLTSPVLDSLQKGVAPGDVGRARTLQKLREAVSRAAASNSGPLAIVVVPSPSPGHWARLRTLVPPRTNFRSTIREERIHGVQSDPVPTLPGKVSSRLFSTQVFLRASANLPKVYHRLAEPLSPHDHATFIVDEITAKILSGDGLGLTAAEQVEIIEMYRAELIAAHGEHVVLEFAKHAKPGATKEALLGRTQKQQGGPGPGGVERGSGAQVQRGDASRAGSEGEPGQGVPGGTDPATQSGGGVRFSLSSGDPKLPADLSKAAPRYSRGRDAYLPEFESDIDRASYIATQAKKSPRDADYVKFVMDALGFTEEQVRAHGRHVRNYISSIAQNTTGGTSEHPAKLRIRKVAQSQAAPAAKAAAPKKAARTKAAPAPAPATVAAAPPATPAAPPPTAPAPAAAGPPNQPPPPTPPTAPPATPPPNPNPSFMGATAFPKYLSNGWNELKKSVLQTRAGKAQRKGFDKVRKEVLDYADPLRVREDRRAEATGVQIPDDESAYVAMRQNPGLYGVMEAKQRELARIVKGMIRPAGMKNKARQFIKGGEERMNKVARWLENEHLIEEHDRHAQAHGLAASTTPLTDEDKNRMANDAQAQATRELPWATRAEVNAREDAIYNAALAAAQPSPSTIPPQVGGPPVAPYKFPEGKTRASVQAEQAAIEAFFGTADMQKVRDGAQYLYNWLDNNLLEYAKSGMISLQGFQAMKAKSKKWVPLRREVKETEDQFADQFADRYAVATGGLLSTRQDRVMERQEGGSKLKVKNVLEQILLDVRRAVALAGHNEVKRKLLSLRVKYPQAFGQDMMTVSASAKLPPGTAELKMRVDGKVWRMAVPADIVHVYEGMQKSDAALLETVLHWFSGTLVKGVVLAPIFQIRNLGKDTFNIMSSFVRPRKFGDSGWYGPLSVAKGAWLALTRDLSPASREEFEDYLKSQGSISGMTQSLAGVGRTRAALRDVTGTGNILRRAWAAGPLQGTLGYTGETAELVNRLGVFHKARTELRKEDVKRTKAAYEQAKTELGPTAAAQDISARAREISPPMSPEVINYVAGFASRGSRGGQTDFTMVGGSMRTARKVFPFLNANVQGRYTTWRVARDNPWQFALRTFLTYVLPALAIYKWNEEGFEDEWDTVTAQQKRTNFIIFYGHGKDVNGTPTDYYKIPLGDVGNQTVGPLVSMMDKMRGKSAASFGRLLAEGVANFAFPVDPLEPENKATTPWTFAARVGVGVIPPPIKTFFGLGTNTELHTWRDIVPETLNPKTSEPSSQYFHDTPPWAVNIGKTFGVSPLKVMYAGRSLAGYLGEAAVSGDPSKMYTPSPLRQQKGDAQWSALQTGQKDRDTLSNEGGRIANALLDEVNPAQYPANSQNRTDAIKTVMKTMATKYDDAVQNLRAANANPNATRAEKAEALRSADTLKVASTRVLTFAKSLAAGRDTAFDRALKTAPVNVRAHAIHTLMRLNDDTMKPDEAEKANAQLIQQMEDMEVTTREVVTRMRDLNTLDKIPSSPISLAETNR